MAMENLQYLDDISTESLRALVKRVLREQYQQEYHVDEILLENWGFSGPFFENEHVFPFKWMTGNCAYGARMDAYKEIPNHCLTRFEMASHSPLIAAWKTIVAKHLGQMVHNCVYVPKDIS